MKDGRAALFYTIIVIFASTALVTLLGLVGILPIKAEYLDLLFKSLLLEVIVTVIGLFKATTWFGNKRLVDAVESIKGHWWQLVRAGDVNAAGFLTIGFSDEQQQLVLSGDSYSATGGEYARWWSTAASLNVATLQLHYFWEGDHAAKSENYSGVGRIGFDTDGREPPSRAAGWFTSGNLDTLEVTFRFKADMRRATAAESSTMISGDVEAKRKLAAQVYAAWKPVGVPAANG